MSCRYAIIGRGSPMSSVGGAARAREPVLAGSNPSQLADRDFNDLEAQLAHRHLDFGDVADLLADQALADGTAGEDLVVVVVFLAGADEVEDFFVAAAEVAHLD